MRNLEGRSGDGSAHITWLPPVSGDAVDYVVESTGLFTDFENASKHLKAGADAPLKDLREILGHPVFGVDAIESGQSRGVLRIQLENLPIGLDRPRCIETTALGAAYLAGLAVGYWSGIDEIRSQWETDRRFEPAMEASRVQQLRGGWERALDRARGWEVER